MHGALERYMHHIGKHNGYLRYHNNIIITSKILKVQIRARQTCAQQGYVFEAVLV